MNQGRFVVHYKFNSLRNKSEQYMRQIIEHIITEIVGHTPVASGRAKANWRLSLDSYEEGKWSCETDPIGDMTISTMIETLRAFVPGGRVYISNSVPYARKWL